MRDIEQSDAPSAAGNSELASVLWVEVKVEDCVWKR